MGEGLAGEEQGSVEESDVAFVAGLLLSLDTTVSGSGLGNFEHRDRERLKVLAVVDRGPEPEPSLVDSLASARGFTDGQVEEVAIALAVAWTDKEALDRGGWRYMARQAVAVLRGPEREGVEAVRQRPTPMGQHPHMGQHNG